MTHRAGATFAWVLATACATAACGDDGGPEPMGDGGGAPDAGPSCTELLWDPGSGLLERWPEPDLVVDDPSTPTGHRLHVDPVRYGAMLDDAAGFASIFTDDLSDLDGFGPNAEAFFRFGRAFDPARVPSGEATADPGAGLGLLVLEPGPPRLQPVIVRFTDDGATPLMAPMRPLPARGRVAAFVTRTLTDAAGGCLEPSPAMEALLGAPDAAAVEAIDALVALGAIADATDLVALSLFPIQSTVNDSVAVAADIAGRDFAFDGPATCITEPEFIVCDLAFVAGDYRGADGVLRLDPAAAGPLSTYRIPVTVWLPTTGARPFRTLLFGHGLGSGREQGRELAEFAAPEGIATVAMPAVQHGEHPSNPEPGSGLIATVLRFFAIGDLSSRAFDGLVHRDNWRQSTYDKLQLTRILQASPDIDGDGSPDLDGSRLAYLGASLGGIMGAELLALTDAYPAAVLAVPGGRVTSIIAESETFGPVVVALRPPSVSEGDVARFFPVMQTVIERGDSASYAPHVLTDRLVGDGSAAPPSVLLGIALDDDTVPNVSNYALARAFDVPIAPEQLRPVPGLVEYPSSPVSGNAAGGAATAAMLQFDCVRRDSGEVRVATHSSTPSSAVGARAWFDFLSSHWEDGLAVVVDPYVLEGLAHGGCAP